LEEAAVQVVVASACALYERFGHLYDEWNSPEEFQRDALEKAQRDLRERRRARRR
jgi:hypothetical protein